MFSTVVAASRMAKKLKPQQELAVIPGRPRLTGYLCYRLRGRSWGAGCGPVGEGELIEWARILAHITRTVDQQLLGEMSI
jgi:hypothetical protein